jgi:hypothetical protein
VTIIPSLPFPSLSMMMKNKHFFTLSLLNLIRNGNEVEFQFEDIAGLQGSNLHSPESKHAEQQRLVVIVAVGSISCGSRCCCCRSK